MNSYRTEKYIERYEDTEFDLETPIILPGNGFHQKKDGYRFIVDNSGEISVFDYYNSRISIDFKVTLLAGGNIAVDDHNGIVNGSFSLIKNLSIKANGVKIYDCNNANQCINIKNLLEYSPTYAKTTATNEFFFLDTNRNKEERPAEDNFNKGFAARKILLGTSTIVNTEIPLNRYSFFESLENQLLPNTRIELNFQLESDANLIWQAGANCRVVVTRMRLLIPRIIFNPIGQSLYMEKFLKPHSWTYLKENIERSNSSTQKTGVFKITSGISKIRHVFVFIINDAKINIQTENSFFYDTFSVANQQTLSTCHLELGNGIDYPDMHYTPDSDISRVFRDILKYVHINNEYQEGSLLKRSNFSTLFPFIYFDLTKQKTDIKDGTTKLTFKYELSAETNAAYSIYALTLNLQDIEIFQQSGKLMLRS